MVTVWYVGHASPFPGPPPLSPSRTPHRDISVCERQQSIEAAGPSSLVQPNYAYKLVVGQLAAARALAPAAASAVCASPGSGVGPGQEGDSRRLQRC